MNYENSTTPKLKQGKGWIPCIEYKIISKTRLGVSNWMGGV